MAKYFEDYFPDWLSGVNFKKPVTFVATSQTGAETITSNSANASTVGPNGTTSPTLNVDSSTANAATGINIKGAAAGGKVALSVISSGTNESLQIDAKGSGTVFIGSATAGKAQIGSSATASSAFLSVYSSNANALTVGATGSTNPALNIDASTASSATGLNIKSAAAASGLALSVISSGSNENLTVDALGTGTVSIGTVSTGKVIVGTLSTGLNVLGPINTLSGTGAIAGGASTPCILFGTVSGLGIYFGSGAPTISAAQGSVYIRTDGSSTSTRLYVNTTGSTTWTNVTTAA